MRFGNVGLFVFAVLFSFSAEATFLPLNNLDREDSPSAPANIDEATFFSVIDRARIFYEPIVREHGGTLNVEARWDDPMVNAHASRTGSDWNVTMYGGLARRPEVTPDGFALVV